MNNTYNGNIVICFTGDTMLGRDLGYNRNTFDSKFVSGDYEEVYGKYLLENYMRKCNLVVGNLETTITNYNKKAPKTFNYRMCALE